MDDQWTEISQTKNGSGHFFFWTYVQIRRMALVSLCGVSDLSNIMSNYSDGVWFREMMQLMTLMVMMVLMI
jgi:hypothetical protein